ncbi:MAG: tetratricopeptide repeat protein [Sorangiineae bacterium]|nr:tetratricopeptide repeat protein [Sorangiineae bacterium]
MVFPLAATEPELPTEVYTPTPSDVRESLRSYAELHTDPRYVVGPPSRRARSRWIGGVVVLGVVVLLGATVGRKFLAEYAQPAAAPSATRDARVADMLEEGNRRLADGDTDGAKEQYDKASVLAEKDPAVLAALARLEVVRADTVWLKLRLLDPEDKDLIAATHRQLGARVGKAEQQVRAALAVAPEDPVVRRAEIDVLRMSGELARAREKLGSIAENPSEPENAYVLAALDLAESVPGWSSVIDRLQTAAGGERALGRARAALVYALARAGRVADAKSELATIDARSRPHPLLAELTAFVKRFSDVADAGPAAEAEVATVDPASLPKLDTSRRTGDDDAPLAGDFRGQLERASAALARGDLTTASNLYGAVLAKQPGNTEALAGLAEVARKRKDPDQAEKLYDQVLEQNPSYLPALMGRADQKWDAGDRKGAIALYRRVLEQAGGGSSYGQRAAARIAEGEGGGAHAGGATAPAPTVAPAPEPAEPKPAEPKPAEPKPAEPKPEEPGIDTTDLPGMN